MECKQSYIKSLLNNGIVDSAAEFVEAAGGWTAATNKYTFYENMSSYGKYGCNGRIFSVWKRDDNGYLKQTGINIATAKRDRYIYL